MSNLNQIAADQWQSSLQNNYGTPEVSLVKGEGAIIWDADNKRYIDMLGGIATTILGHCHPDISAAVFKQINELGHVSNFFSHPQVLGLAHRLQTMVGDSTARTFFCNSGAEANEAALKLSRLTGRTRVVATTGSFHGRTMGSLSLTGQPGKRDPFKPLIKHVKHVPFGEIAALRKAINKKTAMFIVEPIQGENGVVVPPAGYLQAAREITQAAGAILVIDAVQTGMGRTGTWFGYENEGITPDVITLAKGLGGGIPLGAMIALGSYANLFSPGTHGSTFGGSPVACAAANATIDFMIEKKVLDRNVELGHILKAALSQIHLVDSVSGEGLLIGAKLRKPIAKELAKDLLNAGAIVNAANDSVIRLAPPMVITNSQLEEFLQIFTRVCGNHE